MLTEKNKLGGVTADNYYAIIPEWIIYSDISSSAIRLYALLARHADKNTHQGYPSRKRITALIGLSGRQISKSIEELVGIGALRVKRRYGDKGSYTSNLYTLISNNPSPLCQSDTDPYVENDPALYQNDTNPYVKNDPTPYVKTTPLTKVIINQSQLTKDITKEIKEVAIATNPIYESLANYLADCIELNGSKRPTVSDAWIKDIRLLIERDGRTPEQVQKAIDWSSNNGFWRSNILSPNKLRQKYDQLRLNAESENRSKQPKGLDTLRIMHEEETAKVWQLS